MKIYILVLLIITIFLSCKDKVKGNLEVKKQIQLDRNILLKKHTGIKDIDIPYLLKEEKDSILFNRGKNFDIASEKESKKNKKIFRKKIRERRIGVNRLKSHFRLRKEKSLEFVSSVFSHCLLPQEIDSFNINSNYSWLATYLLFKEREAKLTKVIKNRKYLNKDEIQKFIKGEFKDSLYYKELAVTRYRKDSTINTNTFNKRKDSLQSIIHPITQSLPFGPKPLGKMVKQNQKKLSLHVKEGETLALEKQSIRKYFFDIWSFFFELHPEYLEEDLAENYEEYEEVVLPPIKTYEFINVGIVSNLNEPLLFDPKYTQFDFRLPNIKDYEVYYITTGMAGYENCGTYTNIREEDCCFHKESGYGCESTGYLVFYNRKTQHSNIIPSFVLVDSDVYQVQFFYLENNTIHIYSGYSEYDSIKKDKPVNYVTTNEGEREVEVHKSVTIFKTHEIEITDKGDFIVNEICSGLQRDNYEKEKVSYLSTRDSIFKRNQLLIEKYPFGVNLLKEYPNSSSETIRKAITKYKHTFDSKIKYYTLPIPEKINKINIGALDYWHNVLIENLDKNWNCSYNDGAGDVSDHQLPSIGKYEVYFSDWWYNTSILTFYDKITKTANIINTSNTIGNSNRFFYINENSQVEIFQGSKETTSNGKEKYTITKTHNIEVTPNGKIEVIPYVKK